MPTLALVISRCVWDKKSSFFISSLLLPGIRIFWATDAHSPLKERSAVVRDRCGTSRKQVFQHGTIACLKAA